jgi:carbamoyl-phosphate synthase large subunit
MEAIGEPVIPSKVVTTIEDALDFAEVISYPVIVRPAFTLGGTGGGIAANKESRRRVSACHRSIRFWLRNVFPDGRRSSLR